MSVADPSSEDRAEPDVDSAAMADAMKPAYLLSGDDAAKLSAALARLRVARRARGRRRARWRSSAPRAEPAPDADALVGAIPAISLTAERRYLLADGVERWKAAQVKPSRAALAQRSARRHRRPDRPRRRARRASPRRSRRPGARSIAYDAPRKRELPAWLVAAARERGFALAPQAARGC